MFWLHKYAGCTKGTFRSPIFTWISTFSGLLHISIFCFRVRTTNFHFSSWVGVLLGNTADWWMKGFRYTVMWWPSQLASTVTMDYRCNDICNGTCMKEGWHAMLLVVPGKINVWWVNIHVCVLQHFIWSNIIKIVHFLSNVYWLHENSKCLDTR